jgi:DNA-binding NarL/FixJ family response regulator
MDVGSQESLASGRQGDTGVSDIRRWLRDTGALLALPSLWVDHEPREIITGVLSVLSGVLQLESAYARFEEVGGGQTLEEWRPSGQTAPAEIHAALDKEGTFAPGITTVECDRGNLCPIRVTTLRLSLPWETGLIVVSAARADFPTSMETHLLRVAVSQAAIAIHTARRLAHEHAARRIAEQALLRQNELLRSLVQNAEPSLTSIAHRVKELSDLITGLDASPSTAAQRLDSDTDRPVTPAETEGGRFTSDTLTRREMEVLGLLAQGLSNKEIAGVMWVSDRTVERHITSVYRKIGVARRSEATAFALRNGVV